MYELYMSKPFTESGIKARGGVKVGKKNPSSRAASSVEEDPCTAFEILFDPYRALKDSSLIVKISNFKHISVEEIVPD